VPNVTLHATLHAIVEAQIALEDETPARHTAQRLIDDGLDRHEAIHAIALALVEFMRDLMNAPELGTDPNAPYFAALERLTADDWRRSHWGFGHSNCMEGIMFAILRGANGRRHEVDL